MDELRADVPGVGGRVAIHVMDETLLRVPGLLQRMCSLQALSHPGIVRVFDVDQERGALFLTMEWLTGSSLRQLEQQRGGGRLALPAAQTIIRTVAGALAHAHSRDVFHGDVSAQNVLITDTGEVRLKGFELGDRCLAASPQADRLAFAWLAYGLLSGRASELSIRHPAGLPPEQWRVLRNTLSGKQGKKAGNVLTAFAGDSSITVDRVSLLPGFVHARASGASFSAWMATGLVAAIVATAGYFMAAQDALPVSRANGVLTVASASVPEAAPRPAIAEDMPIKVVTASVTMPPPAPAPEFSRPHIDLPYDAMSVNGDQPVAKIWVRRRGPLSGAVTFLWWTESGSAQIDRDFAEVPPQKATIADGAKGVQLLVPLVSDLSRNQPRAFYVKIDEAGSGATLGRRTLMQVAIVPPGYEEPAAGLQLAVQ
jgi:hypothetical protein